MVKCRYCPGTFTRSVIKRHEIECFKNTRMKAAAEEQTRKRPRFDSVAPLPRNTTSVSNENQLPRSETVQSEEFSQHNHGTADESTSRSLAGDFNDNFDYADYVEDLDDPLTFICPSEDDSDETGSTYENISAPLSDTTNAPEPTGEDALKKITRKVFTAHRVPQLTSSELLSLELLNIVEEFNFPKEAHERLVVFANNAITCGSPNSETTHIE
ncbi:hypothetical protein BJV82DRAFT_325486 [Fennellomyces sp. T-0311]|nr:hypothetical protein BJV82DRAFT_325486 [Fennellomyces sp. T-0311]